MFSSLLPLRCKWAWWSPPSVSCPCGNGSYSWWKATSGAPLWFDCQLWVLGWKIRFPSLPFLCCSAPWGQAKNIGMFGSCAGYLFSHPFMALIITVSWTLNITFAFFIIFFSRVCFCIQDWFPFCGVLHPLVGELHGQVPGLQEEEEGGGQRQQSNEFTPSGNRNLIVIILCLIDN